MKAREVLKQLSNEIKPLVEMEQYPTVNQAVINEFYKRDGHEVFNTFNQWKQMGYTIIKGSKAFAVWAQPMNVKQQQPKEGEEDEYSFFPICYLFSNMQVRKPEPKQKES